MLETINTDPEIIRITQQNYDRIVARCQMIQERTDDPYETRDGMKYGARYNIPSVATLEKHDVVHHLRKYLPYLVFYGDENVLTPNVDDDALIAELEETRAYIKQIFAEYVDIIDNDAMAAIEKYTVKTWNKMDFDGKVDAFRELISYYGAEEFTNFYQDLGYQRFMAAYDRMTELQYYSGKVSPAYQVEIRKIWDTIQAEYSAWYAEQTMRR